MLKLNRSEAIAAIRKRLLEMIDDDHSMCQVAAEHEICCHGFARLNDEQLHQRYSWLLRNNPGMSRQELMEAANRWELARQAVNQVPISCDSQCIEKDTCEGWDGFNDATIARYFQEILGEQVEIIHPLPCLSRSTR